MVKLRPFQTKLKSDIYAAWQNSQCRNVLAMSATGTGKTVIMADILSEHNAPSVVVAHRQELVSQVSMALARNGVRHRIVGATSLAKSCATLHLRKLRRSYVDANSKCAVASVNTLVGLNPTNAWFQQVTLFVCDESHHLLKENMWGRALSMFPNARALGFTATPGRADGKGLGFHAQGVFNVMVQAPSMRDQINAGYLTPYKVYCPPSDIDLSKVTVGASGDFSQPQVRTAVHASKSIVGNIVEHYLKLAANKLGVTFAVDVEAAIEIAEAFRVAGVPAAVVTAKSSDAERAHILGQFERRELLQLVNVDLFGEGFDLPQIEVVCMARPTQSFGLYTQQFGRALRLDIDDKYLSYYGEYSDEERRAVIAASRKPFAIIIDHVNNVFRHNGTPDAYREWTLDAREKRSSVAKDDVIPLRGCLSCFQPFEKHLRACPWCNAAIPEPSARSAPEYVDGVLQELTADALRALGVQIAKVDEAAQYPRGASAEIVGAIFKRHAAKREAIQRLRYLMQVWGGYFINTGLSLDEAQSRFYFAFAIDVGTAQTLNAKDAGELSDRILKSIRALHIDLPDNSG
jgi:superfamily II DNA or RNA helicase